MSNNGQFKRRNYFINKEFQGKTIFHYFILLALGSILFVGIFSFFSSNTLSIVYDNYHLRLGTTPGILFKKMLSTQWLFIVIGGIAVIFITMRLTHRPEKNPTEISRLIGIIKESQRNIETEINPYTFNTSLRP
jgi:hypothetical protein